MTGEPDVGGGDLVPTEHCRCGRTLRIRRDDRRRWWARCLCGRYVAHHDLNICRANIKGEK